MQFWGKFTFNGYNDDRYMIVNVEDGEERAFGTIKQIDESESVGFTPLYNKEKRDCPTLTIQITKIDKRGILLPFTEYDLQELNRELFASEEYGVLEVESHGGVVFYGKFLSGSIKQNSGSQGYLTLKFRLASPYGFSSVNILSARVINTKTIDVIYNRSDIVSVIRPNIQVKLLEDTTEVEIINKTNGSRMKLVDLQKEEDLEICNDGYKEIISKVDSTRNLFMNIEDLTNFDWIEFVYGKNILEINCNGSVDVAIKYQYPIAMK